MRRLKSLFEHLAQLSLEVAHRFLGRVDLLFKLTRLELYGLSAGSTFHGRAALRLTDCYFDALAALRARDLNFFIVKTE
jgi:hypothetical protein